MSTNDPINWMLSEALGSLARAERLRQQFFSLRSSGGPSWEPPIDVLETDDELLIPPASPSPAPVPTAPRPPVLSRARASHPTRCRHP